VTLRGRIATTAALAVAVAVVLAFAGLYLVTARALVGEVDRSLHQVVRDLGRAGDGPLRPGGLTGGPRAGPYGGAGGYVRAVRADGQVLGDAGADRLDLPVSDRTRAVAAGEADQYLATVELDGQRFRVLTTPTRLDLAVQVARPLGEVDASLAVLRRRLVLFGLLGVGLAAGMGMLVARGAVRPVDRLTGLAEEVAATQDLTRRIDVDRQDEVGRLATTFNAMLGALEQARAAQEQLVADASHELRTPLTSLRTNIEVLARGDELDEASRRALIDDVVLQLDEFARLVTGLVELARGDRPARGAVPVRLDELAERVVARARTHDGDGPALTFHGTPTTVLAESDRVERAVTNLVDNAVKYGGAGGRVEVAVADGAVTVRDHGPGIAEPDLPHVFDRFYRAVEARGAPGSGLGLSIVAQVAAAHGGTATAENAPDGGAVLRLALPTTDDHGSVAASTTEPPPSPPPPGPAAGHERPERSPTLRGRRP
jgi:two-component system sensor histidine kinase MprB